MITRDINSGPLMGDYLLAYDAENRLVEVRKDNAIVATFVYDGDGKQVKATVNGEVTIYVGSHYEVKDSIVTKYYFAGSTRIALRENGTLNYLLSDHLGSSSVTMDANGVSTATMLYKAWGETRYSTGDLNTDYEYTGQRNDSYINLLWYGSRHYDPELGRFTSADSIVPAGVQGYDRYAYVNNSPVNFVDPSGHMKGDPCDGAESGYKCNRDRHQQQLAQQAAEKKYGTALNEFLEQIEEKDSYCDEGSSGTTCSWTFNSSEDKDLFKGFVKLLREINQDPVSMDLLFGFIPLDPFTGAIENLAEIFRGEYYDKLSNFEDALSNFYGDFGEDVFVRFTYTEDRYSRTKPPTISSNLTAYSNGFEGADNLYLTLDVQPTESITIRNWLSNELGN